MSKDASVMDKITALCRRRGFIFGSSEIYGGINGFWDYGPLGCELKRNIKEAWWKDMVHNPPSHPGGREFQMVGVDCSIIMNPKVWEASGHVGGFSDPMVACKTEGCKGLFRADKTWTIELAADVGTNIAGAREYVGAIADSEADAIALSQPQISKFEKRHRQQSHPIAFCAINSDDILRFACPKCQQKGCLTPPRAFNLMYKTHSGALEDSSSLCYLRPETAQGIFANFQNVMDSTRVRLPFGIAQIGKAFRNEINPRNYTFRSREFEQMEIEFFCRPDESLQWYEFWRDARINWYKSLGIASDKLRPRQQGKEELAHYSSACTDIEYMFPFSDEPQELEGVAHRGDFDLKAHGKHAKGKEDAFAIFDDETRERYVPHVVEPSAGADRFTLAVICEAYSHDESRASPEFMRFHPRLAPIKAAVFPLVAKDGMPEVAEPIYRELRKHFIVQFDAKQTIGKRYARMDEAGAPFCFTIDGQSKEDGTVTVRNRDDARQERIDKSRCLEYLKERLEL